MRRYERIPEGVVDEDFVLYSQDGVYIGHVRRRRNNKNPKALLTLLL